MYLASKTVCYKLYNNFQFLPVSTYQWKDLPIDFMTGLPISTNWKGDFFNSILVIVDWPTKMVHYKPIKTTIDQLGLVKLLINVIVKHDGRPDSNLTNKSLIVCVKVWLLLWYFFDIKYWLSTVFYPQTDGYTKLQNSTIDAYFRAFINFK